MDAKYHTNYTPQLCYFYRVKGSLWAYCLNNAQQKW